MLSDENPCPNSTPLSSPSRILKENDIQWLNSEVNDYSLTSLLGHLESPLKTAQTTIITGDDNVMSQDVCVINQIIFDIFFNYYFSRLMFNFHHYWGRMVLIL